MTLIFLSLQRSSYLIKKKFILYVYSGWFYGVDVFVLLSGLQGGSAPATTPCRCQNIRSCNNKLLRSSTLQPLLWLLFVYFYYHHINFLSTYISCIFPVYFLYISCIFPIYIYWSNMRIIVDESTAHARLKCKFHYSRHYFRGLVWLQCISLRVFAGTNPAVCPFPAAIRRQTRPESTEWSELIIIFGAFFMWCYSIFPYTMLFIKINSLF